MCNFHDGDRRTRKGRLSGDGGKGEIQRFQSMPRTKN